MSNQADSNRRVVTDFWAALYDRDWDRIASFFTDESVYTDMPTPADDLARGPEQILKRLRLGIERSPTTSTGPVR